MTTITDTSVLHWLPFDDIEADPWKLAFIDAENQNWNSTDVNNGTTTLEKMAASKHGDTFSIVGSPAQLGLATGLLLSLVINSRIWTTKANGEGGCRKLLGDPKKYQWILHLTPSSSFIFASTKTFILHYLYLLPLLAFVLLTPLLLLFLVILLPFIIYRLAVFVYLEYRERRHDAKIKLLSGADAVWTFNESHESYSVINALLLLEGKPDILQLKEIFRNRFRAFPKLRMRRDTTLGYTTWYEDKDLDLGKLVQWLPGSLGDDFEEDNGYGCGELENPSGGKWNRVNLSEIIEELCNLPLPQGHSVSWEARVGKARIWKDYSDEESKNSRAETKPEIKRLETQTVFPILFRIHHSIGDGASLLQLMMSTLIDNETAETKASSGQRTENPTSKSNTKVCDQIPTIANGNISLRKHEFENQEAFSNDESDEREGYNRKNGTIDSNPKIQKCFTKINEERESSYLYGRRLSGKKIILWDSESVTVEDVKKIRAATGVKFTDILLSAVSASLANYWELRKKQVSNDHLHSNGLMPENKLSKQKEEGQKKAGTETGRINEKLKEGKEEKPPSSVKLVIPAILGSLFQKPKCNGANGNKELENLFSVAIMTLPIGKGGGCPLKRLAKVSDASGCMMPIRKESIIDYKSKLSNHVFSKKPDKSDSFSLVPDTRKVRATSSTEQKHVKLYDDKSMESENKNSEITTDSSDKTGIISPHGAEVLTYYYTTKKSDSVTKIDPLPSSALKKDSTVLYDKKDDSAKLIIHNKEPYGCPTTIFFTHKNQNSTTSSRKDEMFEKEERVEEPQGEEDCSTELSLEKHSEVVNKEDFEGSESEKGLRVRPNQENPKPETPPPPPSLNLPSSPTIQHLIMRWLALDIVATVIPSFIAAPMMALASKGVAVVMSNLPGPTKKLRSILGGHPMKEIVFWAPHRGYTGVGITVISYDGKLEIGLMVDEAVVPTRSGAQFILNAVLDELHSLRGAVSTTH